MQPFQPSAELLQVLLQAFAHRQGLRWGTQITKNTELSDLPIAASLSDIDLHGCF